jgi:hypothetical protein
VTGPRRWWWRTLLAAFAFGAAELVFTELQDDPDPVRLALVVLLLVFAGAMLLDSAQAPSAEWPIFPLPTTGLSRADPRTAALLRLVEGHLTASEPSAALRDRLRDLTDQVLQVRHDLPLVDPRAEALVGAPLLGVLTDPPRRLARGEIEQCLRQIEEL